MTEQTGSAFSMAIAPAPAGQASSHAAAAKPAPPPAHDSARFMLPTLLEAARSLLTMVVVALFLLTFVVQPFRIPSESMERTLLVGDFLLVNKMIYAPRGLLARLLPYRDVTRGDIIVFRFPLDPSDYVVKRVLGLPGDRIHLTNGVVYRNGQPLDEPYAVYEEAYRDNFRDQFPAGLYTDPGVDTHWWLEMRANLDHGDLVVPPDNYFVLGDNRNHSRDSRYWGFVPRSTVIGRPFVIYFSLREPSATDTPTLPTDRLGRLGHSDDPVTGLIDFARWDRMFRIVR
jgi:signal peptidase I